MKPEAKSGAPRNQYDQISLKVMAEDGINRNIFVFLIFVLASNDETRDHLDSLFETKSLKNKALYNELISKCDIVGKKLNLFIQSVEKNN